MKLYFASSNKDKLRELQAILWSSIEQIDVDIPEIQSLDVDEVVRAKAIAAYQKTGKVVIVEDTGLYFDAWQGLPGALIRWFMKTVGNNGICQMLTEVSNRSALAKTSVAIFDGISVFSFSGEIRGMIPLTPTGHRGFGWDPIFRPVGFSKTFAQMTEDEKNSISMRRMALEKLRQHLSIAES